MIKRLTITIAAVCLWGMSETAVAQQKGKPGPSTNTSWEAKVEEGPREKKSYRTIYRQNAYGIFLGNKCVEESIRNMGFRYELVPRQGPGSKSAMGVFLHNTGAKIVLLFRNGPFWQCRLRRKIDNCRIQTGDYIGYQARP